MLSIYRAGEIDLFENLDIVHIRLLVEGQVPPVSHGRPIAGSLGPLTGGCVFFLASDPRTGVPLL